MVIHAHALMNSMTHSTPKRCTKNMTHRAVSGSSGRKLSTEEEELVAFSMASKAAFWLFSYVSASE